MSDKKNANGVVTKLRISTYMCPDYPEGLYHVFKEFFEDCLGVECELNVVNSHAHDDSPFVKDTADIVFMNLVSYMKIMQQEEPVLWHVLRVAPTFDLLRRRDDSSSYSEVIILNSKKDYIKSLNDLRGHRWSFVEEKSWVLYELSKLGHNYTFFGHMISMESEKEGTRSVMNHSSDGTSVDGAILKSYLDEFPDCADKLHVVTSWGPYPPQPILLSNKLSDDMKDKLTSSLVSIKQHYHEFASKFMEHNVTGFDYIDVRKFQDMADSLRRAEKMKMPSVYY